MSILYSILIVKLAVMMGTTLPYAIPPPQKKKGTGAPNQRAAATVEEMEPGVYGEALKVCWKKMGWWHDPPTYGWRMNRLSTQMAGRWKVWQFADGNIKLVGGFNPSEKY